MTHATPRELLTRYGLAAKKSWGQNFLVDERIYTSIVAACALDADDVALEIGAGLGTLTARLLDSGAQVYAVERDDDMCQVLQAELGQRPNFHLLAENALTLDLARVPPPVKDPARGITAVGNLPYHIASPLIFRLLAERQRLRRLVVMVQREVAERMLAQVGDDDYSSMSVNIQFVAAARRICRVGPQSFLPAPRVQSMVVMLEPRAQPLHPVQSLTRFNATVRAAFGQRRKTLRNALSMVFGAAALPALQAAAIDPQRRGETLTLAEFARLSDQLPELSELQAAQQAAELSEDLSPDRAAAAAGEADA